MLLSSTIVEQEIQQMAKRKVQYVDVSTSIRSQSQLFWHRSDMEVHPCRTCERDEAMCLPGIPETWDEKRKVLVQYIVYPNVGQMRLVSRKQLTPYHGHGNGSNKRKVQRANGTMVGGGSWCENLMERYRKQRSKQLRNGSISSGGTNANGGKRKSKSKKGGSVPMPSRDDVRVNVLVQTLYLQKVLDSVRSVDSSDSDSDHRVPDGSIGSASGSNWGSKIMKKKATTFEFSDKDKKKDDSSSDSEGEGEEISWSQELNNRLEPRQKNQATAGSRGAKSKHKDVSSSEDSNEDMDDDEETEPTYFSQDRDNRMEVKKGAASITTATAKPKSRDIDVGSDSSSTISDKELRQDTARQLNDSAETNESISLSSDSSDSESEEETGPIEEEALSQKRWNTGRSSKGRVSFAGTSYAHDDDDRDEGGSDEDVEDDDDHEPMDIPYTQALGLESDDDYLPPPILDPENIKSKEPIRPGDIIEYSSFLFVAGDKRGHREARVISVDPSRDPALVLDTGEILPNDTKIRRTKVLVGDKLRAHAGVSRPIHSFVLEKAVMKGRSDKISAGFAKEASRVGGIIRRNMAKFQEKAEADGFAPLDVMNKYKGTNFDSNGGSMKTIERGKTKKKSGLLPINERPKIGFTAKTRPPSHSSSLSESSSSDSEEEQSKKSPATSKTKWISSKQGKKKYAGASPAVDLSSSSEDDDDVMFESPALRLPTVPKRSSRTKDRKAMSSASSSSSDCENSCDERKRSSNKRKSPHVKKTPRRDVWDTSPRKKSSAAKKKKDKKHDSLSFESSDDDFEPKGRRRMITVSDKKKKQIKPSSSSKKKAKTKKNSSPSSPLIDMTSSDEKEKDGWMQRLGGRTKKPKASNVGATTSTIRRRKKKKEEGSVDSNLGAGSGAVSAFFISRAK